MRSAVRDLSGVSVFPIRIDHDLDLHGLIDRLGVITREGVIMDGSVQQKRPIIAVLDLGEVPGEDGRGEVRSGSEDLFEVPAVILAVARLAGHILDRPVQLIDGRDDGRLVRRVQVGQDADHQIPELFEIDVHVRPVGCTPEMEQIFQDRRLFVPEGVDGCHVCFPPFSDVVSRLLPRRQPPPAIAW